MKKLIQNTISSNAFWQVNKALAKLLKVGPAILLADLISKEGYFQNRGMTDKAGGFFNLDEQLTNELGFDKRTLKKYRDKLKETGFLSIRRKGIPPKLFYYIKHEKIADYLKNYNNVPVKDSYIVPIKDSYIVPDINNNKTISANNKVDSIESNIGQPKVVPENPLIKYWNSLGKVKHNPYNKRNNKLIPNKTYLSIVKFIKLLKSGEFGNSVAINQDFLTKHKIPKRILKKKWTDKEIKENMDNLKNYLTIGFWPSKNGDSKTPNLPSLIFNKNTGSSIFLWVWIENPKPEGAKVKNLFPEVTKQYKLLFDDMTKIGEQILISNVNKLMKRHHKILDTLEKYNQLTGLSWKIGTKDDPGRFTNIHLGWLSNQSKLNISDISPTSTKWKYFLDYFYELENYDISLTKSSIKEIKFQADKVRTEKRNAEAEKRNYYKNNAEKFLV
jgi:hypothetical protein